MLIPRSSNIADRDAAKTIETMRGDLAMAQSAGDAFGSSSGGEAINLTWLGDDGRMKWAFRWGIDDFDSIDATFV